MKILFVNERGAFFGGVEQHIVHAATELRVRGHECRLAFGTDDGTSSEAFQSVFASVHQVAPLAPFAGREDAEWLQRLWEERPFDAVYFHKLPALPDLDRLPASVRTVQMVHDHDLCCPRRHKYFATGGVCRQAAGWRCCLDAAFVRRDRTAPLGVQWLSIGAHQREMRRHWALDALLVGSGFMRDELLMNGAPADRVHVVPPVVPARPFDQATQPHPRSVLYVGQLIRGKGVDRLLRAMARVPKPWRLVLAGRGNHEPALRRLAGRLGIGDQVEFLGWVAPDDLPGHYARAAVVAVPSRWPEPFGMVGLEAMRLARPVVAFDVGGIGDWLHHDVNGRLAPDGDVKQFAREVATLLDDPALARRLGLNGRLELSTRFQFPRCVDALERHLAGRQHEVRRSA